MAAAVGRSISLSPRPSQKASFGIFREYLAALIAEVPKRSVFADLKYHHVGPVDPLWRFADEAPPPVAAFVATDGTIIHLVRRNPLAQLASLQLARETGVWVAQPSGQQGSADAPSKPPRQVRIKTAGIIEKLSRIELRKMLAKYWVAPSRRQIELAYEDILEGEFLSAPVRAALEDLLERDIDLGGRAGTLKIAPPLGQLIENFDDVCTALSRSEFAWCTDANGTSERRQAVLHQRVARPPAEAQSIAQILQPHVLPPGGEGRVVLVCCELPAFIAAPVDLVALAERLAAAGFRPILALPDAVQRYRKPSGFPIVQSPIWPAIAARAVPLEMRDYAELLSAIGLADPASVVAIAAAWRALIKSLRPAAIIATHSPGLVAVCAADAIPVIDFGEAKNLPPATQVGFPKLLSARCPPTSVRDMLAALRAIGCRPARDDGAALALLLQAPSRVVFGLPELDPFHWSRDEKLAAPAEAFGLPPRSELRRLLAVLPPAIGVGTPFATEMLAVDPSAQVIDAEVATGQLLTALAGASHVICLTGSPASTAAMAGGRPQLVVLDGGDGEIAARLVEQQLVGSRLDPQASGAALRARIFAFLQDAKLAEQATSVAHRIAARAQPDHIEMLLNLVAAAALQPTHHDRRDFRFSRAPAAAPS